ncbi:MAG TPA: transcriptional regulator [Microcoleaceae bacterium UBA11344]|nr:transcriptional regulator [Microcoleaceae cyanobacterium UBA11344]
MKIPILLKVLQNSKTSNPQFPTSRKGDEGFSLLEMMMIVLIIGILTSIAVPGWLAFINNQRVRTVNDRVFQTLRSAQSEAKRNKRNITVTFNPTPATDPPTVTFIPPLATGGSTQTLDVGGEIKKGTIALSTNVTASVVDVDLPLNSIVFDYQGNVKKLPPDKSVTPNVNRFVVTVVPASGGAKKCVIVETLLGGMRTDEGAACN